METIDWPALDDIEFVQGRLATEEDVNEGRAVFFIRGDAKPAGLTIPQYAWFSQGPDDERQPCILIQAEETIDGCMLGLRGLDGSFSLGVQNDVELLGQMAPPA